MDTHTHTKRSEAKRNSGPGVCMCVCLTYYTARARDGYAAATRYKLAIKTTHDRRQQRLLLRFAMAAGGRRPGRRSRNSFTQCALGSRRSATASRRKRRSRWLHNDHDSTICHSRSLLQSRKSTYAPRSRTISFQSPHGDCTTKSVCVCVQGIARKWTLQQVENDSSSLVTF